MDRWISIKKQEPPVGVKILIKELWSNEMHTAFWHPDENRAEQYKESCTGFYWAFSHWMSLPEPPKKDHTHGK